jgi:hypothetical protein
MDEHTPEHGEGTPEDAERKPEDNPQEPGAEGGTGAAEEEKTPFSPSEHDDSPAGDTDQHSRG